MLNLSSRAFITLCYASRSDILIVTHLKNLLSQFVIVILGQMYFENYILKSKRLALHGGIPNGAETL